MRWIQGMTFVKRALAGIALSFVLISGSWATEPPSIEPPEAIPKLLAELKDSDPAVRRGAVIRLGRVSPRSEDALRVIRPAFLQALQDGDKWVRYQAAMSLSAIDPSSEEAVSVLLKVLEDKDEALRAEPEYMGVSFRDSVIFHLGDIPLFAEKTVPVLVQIAREETPRSIALHPLAKLGRPAVPALIGLLEDPNPEVRADAMETLGEIGPEAKEAAPALVQTLKDNDEPMDSLAFSVLLGIGPGAVPALSQALESEDEGLRFRAEDLLEQIGTPEALEAVRLHR